jgi:NAD(P)-dependent dehydrogenase (short-subunit alcohol dehydrogenase family)
VKQALVTGSASGIGRACTATLAEAGYEVTTWDLASNTPVDVASSESVRVAAEHLEQPLDALVLAAGVSRMAALVDTSDDDWYFQMNVNAFGVFNCLRALVPRMRDGGAIAVIDSVGGLRGAPFLSAYCASKFAVTGLIEAAAPEFAVRDIRINGVCPMYVRTPMETRELAWEAEIRGVTPEEVFAGYETSTPLRRVAEPVEIADTVLFLVSDNSRYVTGSMLTVSGGAHLGFTVERRDG